MNGIAELIIYGTLCTGQFVFGRRGGVGEEFESIMVMIINGVSSYKFS